jgi:hypothetical protein
VDPWGTGRMDSGMQTSVLGFRLSRVVTFALWPFYSENTPRHPLDKHCGWSRSGLEAVEKRILLKML